jgi:hypothetical protein
MTKPLSDTQTQILLAPAQHEARLATPPTSLPAVARNAVFRSMLNAGLLEEVPAPAEHHDLRWRQKDDGWIALRITEAGLRAVGIEPETATGAAEEARVAPSGPPARLTLREAATALLVAWDAGTEHPALPASMEALRSALAGRRGQGRTDRAPPSPASPGKARSSRTSSPSYAGPRAPPSPRSWTPPAGPSTQSGASWLG